MFNRLRTGNPLLTVTIGTLVMIVFVLVLATACGEPNKLTSGTVIDKEYDDPDENWVPGYTIPGSETCTGGYGSAPRVCTRGSDTHIPGRMDYDGPHWKLRIEGKDEDGKVREEWHEVDQSEYDRMNIGVTWEK